ncbi:MAG TPA: hypothetical protein VIQ30_08780, partial [Pseudonocardia sp.]
GPAGMCAAGPVATRLVQGVTAEQYFEHRIAGLPGLRGRTDERAPAQAALDTAGTAGNSEGADVLCRSRRGRPAGGRE